MMSLSSLRLLHGLLCSQQIAVGADRAEIDAILAARTELEAAISDIEATVEP